MYKCIEKEELYLLKITRNNRIYGILWQLSHLISVSVADNTYSANYFVQKCINIAHKKYVCNCNAYLYNCIRVRLYSFRKNYISKIYLNVFLGIRS